MDIIIIIEDIGILHTLPMHFLGPAKKGINASGSRLATFSGVNRSGLYLEI
jgi:hypothetical protein